MLNCLLRSHRLLISQSRNKKLSTHFLFKNRNYLMCLPTKLTALSWSKTTFFCCLFTKTVNIAVKIQRKVKHEAGRGMIPHADKSTACGSLYLNEPLLHWALLYRNVMGSKHLEPNRPPPRLPVLQILQWEEDLKALPCRWFKDPT